MSSLATTGLGDSVLVYGIEPLPRPMLTFYPETQWNTQTRNEISTILLVLVIKYTFKDTCLLLAWNTQHIVTPYNIGDFGHDWLK